jgi:hypothetical protein
MQYGLKNDSETVFFVACFYNDKKTDFKIIRIYQESELEDAKRDLEEYRRQSFYPHGIIRSEKTIRQSVFC